ncbi:hypothetical protein GRF59_14930 [Paenibacillus sp. HJL G12]|uniref:Uncharacterized protein n=1 Tax=Paenibacillus dendrobii TaxID=2691084 RepID=A0A7X3LJ21_9BACL|nr:hypothetical protein [Paenibacillus dendrobii]MWV44914.1 hypothetical protein [Paenibacillus dendrobii]
MKKDKIVKGYKWNGNEWIEKRDTEEKLNRYGFCLNRLVWLREQIILNKAQRENGVQPDNTDDEVKKLETELERINKAPISHLEAQRQLDNYFKQAGKDF